MDLLEVLDQKGIYYKKTNNPTEILISCTSGLHDDSIFHCWACDFSGGSSKFLSSIGIVTKLPLESKQPYKIRKLREKLNQKIEYGNFSMPKNFRSIQDSYRNITIDILKFFNAFYTTEYGFEDYICIPIKQFGKLRFIEGRNRFNNDKPKYYRQPTNAQISDVLFPIDKIKNKNHLILVEGLFDVINMWNLGYENAVCIFGTANFNIKKVELLEKLGVIKVSILMDGDDAGRRAAQRIKNLVEKVDIQSKIINLPYGKDPGDLLQTEIKFLLEEIN
jgi:DNA primase